jgi:hypothetical protein
MQSAFVALVIITTRSKSHLMCEFVLGRHLSSLHMSETYEEGIIDPHARVNGEVNEGSGDKK